MNDSEYRSLGSLLDDMHSLFPPALVGDSGWERIQALTSRLPVHAACCRFGFEFDLGDTDAAGDFCAVAPAGSRLAAFYRELSPVDASSLAPPGFAAFLTRQEEDPQSLLAKTDSTPVLEYDLAAAPPGHHGPPGVFIMPRGSAENQTTRFPHALAEVISELESVAGWERGAIDMRQVERVKGASAGAGLITHAGVMPGRNLQAVRLIIQGVEHAAVAGVLERLRWEGEPALAESALSRLAGLVRPRVGLGVDVASKGVSPRLGLELYRPVERHQADRAGWKLVGDRLVEQGWCLPAKAAGLAEWPGVELLFGRAGAYQVRKTVNHIKLVFDHGAVSVKGYVAMDVLRRT